MKIKKYEYQKVEKEVDFNIPEETIYLFETEVRRIVCVIPEWTTWNMKQFNKPEEIWRLTLIMVYASGKNKIERIEIQVSSIPEILEKQESPLYYLISSLHDKDYNVRTKEQFEANFNNVLNNIKEGL